MVQSPGPALAMLLLGEIPPGLRVLDALAKEAEVEVLQAGTIHCGRYLILFGGEVGPVERSWRRALETAGSHVVDEVLLPHAEAVPDAQLHQVDERSLERGVDLVELRVGDGLGGNAIASLWGETHDVEAAIELARSSFEKAGAQGSSTAVIPRADPAVREALGSGSRFFKEFRG